MCCCLHFERLYYIIHSTTVEFWFVVLFFFLCLLFVYRRAPYNCWVSALVNWASVSVNVSHVYVFLNCVHLLLSFHSIQQQLLCFFPFFCPCLFLFSQCIRIESHTVTCVLHTWSDEKYTKIPSSSWSSLLYDGDGDANVCVRVFHTKQTELSSIFICISIDCFINSGNNSNFNPYHMSRIFTHTCTHAHNIHWLNRHLQMM